MPAGTYRLVVGLYDATGRRAVAAGPDNQHLPDDQVLLTHLNVLRRDRYNFMPLLLR
jgi:hypothetical protein